jgi:hypothetical protein
VKPAGLRASIKKTLEVMPPYVCTSICGISCGTTSFPLCLSAVIGFHSNTDFSTAENGD